MFKTINAVQIHVSLDEIEPEIWRRLVLPSGWNLGQLHLAIQAAFNWWNYHLHEFQIGGLRYGDVGLLTQDADEDDPRVFDCREVRLRDFAHGAVFNYVYDFGDNWRHTVMIEEFVALDVAPKHGTCIDGARARPPEDVGGVPGYERFLEIMSDKTDPEHADTRRWVWRLFRSGMVRPGCGGQGCAQCAAPECKAPAASAKAEAQRTDGYINQQPTI
ncbi:plasmid pRiA4b ORF-3 family protein [Mesorhizobium sp.]|uniref:plasmid pRiA4b ORF-3 family protein n=1 Tax=Mesorhizobium sp. TaxID=1871066 RepID=UPI0025BE5EF8|nr:plasmid pRiA4b ORF-3 family protein [Mesorhizobium sp.]